MTSRIPTLERRIQRIKAQLLALEDLRPGNLSKQYTVCGKEGCRCQADPSQRHGPYLKLGWTRKRRSTTRFVRREDAVTVRAQVRNYQRLQKLLDQWIEAAIELCELKIRQAPREAAPSKRT